MVYNGHCYYTYHFSWWPWRTLGSLKGESEKRKSNDNQSNCESTKIKQNNKPGLLFPLSVQLDQSCPVVKIRKKNHRVRPNNIYYKSTFINNSFSRHAQTLLRLLCCLSLPVAPVDQTAPVVNLKIQVNFKTDLKY